MRILIVKLSSLGDVVHTLPVVHDIVAAHPGATVDWAVEPAFAPVVARTRGIGTVIEVPLRRAASDGWLSASTRVSLVKVLHRLRRDRYDSVLDLQGLTKSALVASLARGPSWSFANRTEGSSHEWPARALASHAVRVDPRIHAVDRARLLATKALGTQDTAAPVFGLVAAERMPLDPRRVVLVHGTSRADKLWPEDHWVELGRRLLAAGRTLALPHADAAERERAGRIAAAIRAIRATRSSNGAESAAEACAVWPSMPLGALVDRMAATGGAIGVDSGPSHLAVALDLPHVQIYNHPTAWRTGPQPRHGHQRQRAVEGKPTPSVDAVWSAWRSVTETAASSPTP